MFCLPLFFGAMLLLPPGFFAAEISSHYLSDKGKTIILQLSIGSPAPNTIIVVQHLPPGSNVINSSPPHNTYKKKSEKIKWLIKNPTSGNMAIQLHLQDQVDAGSFPATVRYMDSRSGAFKANRNR